MAGRLLRILRLVSRSNTADDDDAFPAGYRGGARPSTCPRSASFTIRWFRRRDRRGHFQVAAERIRHRRAPASRQEGHQASTLEPPLSPDSPGFSFPLGINNRERAVGTEEGSQSLVAVLSRDGGVFNLNELIRADDPLKPFVNLTRGWVINNWR